MFFFPYENIAEAAQIVANTMSGDIVKGAIGKLEDNQDVDFEYRIRIPLKKFLAGIRVATVRMEREPVNPGDIPCNGLVFDTDVYWRRVVEKGGLPRAETSGFLNNASQETYTLLETYAYQLLEGL